PLAMLMTWHENDPVSQKEQDRNNAIYHWQGNRNPFVDRPEFVEHIWGDGPNESGLNEFAHELIVSPNPADDVLNLRFGSTCKGDRELVLYDICGKPALNRKSSETTVTLDVEALPAGMYFLQIESIDHQTPITRRIVIK
ncbi:MAG: endonuclease, partial [Bacteroidota bacterium]